MSLMRGSCGGEPVEQQEFPIPDHNDITTFEQAAQGKPEAVPSPSQARFAERGRPFEGPAAAARAAPFLATTAFALLLSVLLGYGDRGPTLLLAVTAFAVGVAIVVAVPWERLPRWAQAVPPLAFLAVVALVREAEGGAAAAFTPMLALPTIWFALYGTRVELGLAVAGGGLVIALPIALGTDPATGAGTELAAAAIWTAVLAIAGFGTTNLVRQREELLENVTELARTDALTGLANRRGWQELLRREMARAQRDGSALSVAVVDLDRFKNFNDLHGHAAGDRLLKEAAARWTAQIREVDLIARHGGEEFALMLPGASGEEARLVVERLRRHTPEGVTISGGVAEWDRDQHADALLARADGALYEAKRTGRDRVLVSAR